MDKKISSLSPWRRIAYATWRAPNNPTVYGTIKLDASPALTFLTELNRNSSIKITPTHLMAKVTALLLAKYPDLNCRARWGQIYQRGQVDISLQVALDEKQAGGKADLSGAKIEDADQKSLARIAEELTHKSRAIRTGSDPQFQRTKALLQWMPTFLLPCVLKFLEFCVFELNLNLPKLGLIRDPFGSAMVTSVGTLGLPSAFAPLVPLSRCPLIICVGAIKDEVVAIDGQIKVQPQWDLSVSFDHRFLDGLIASRMLAYAREILAQPEKYMHL